MMTNPQNKTCHGVLVAIANKGILITGAAGVGKSSLALELLYLGHTLIADDHVEVQSIDDKLIGQCPSLLHNILHTRELGLISIPLVFGPAAWKQKHAINYVVNLQTESTTEISLGIHRQTHSLLGKDLPLLKLNTQNPASLVHRILCWISMLSNQHATENEFKQRQAVMMASQ